MKRLLVLLVSVCVAACCPRPQPQHAESFDVVKAFGIIIAEEPNTNAESHTPTIREMQHAEALVRSERTSYAKIPDPLPPLPHVPSNPTLDPIVFKKGSAILTHQDEQALDVVAARILENYVASGVKVWVEGYSSPEGSRAHNMALSQARAREVVNYLVSQGVPEDSLKIKAVGASTTPVVIYGTSWCPACHYAAGYLASHNIPFIAIDIERDAQAHKDVQAMCAAAGVDSGFVPIIAVGGTVQRGYDVEDLRTAIAKADERNRRVQFVPYIEQ